MVRHLSNRRNNTKRFALLVAVVFACELLFLLLADVPMNNASDVIAELQPTDVSGVAWTGFSLDWFFNLFASNDADMTVAGVAWTGFSFDWFFNLFG
ncbi:hypothetical protein K8I61_06690 [bacterium]|nr:hypothetical protein [bacterium]